MRMRKHVRSDDGLPTKEKGIDVVRDNGVDVTSVIHRGKLGLSLTWSLGKSFND